MTRDEPPRYFRGIEHARVSFHSTARNLASDPSIYACFQHVERQASSIENFIMEGLDIELGTKLLLCAVAKIQNLELTYLIAEGLSRPCNIPINFSFDRRLIRSTAFAEVDHRLFPSPTFGVNARVNHYTDRTH